MLRLLVLHHRRPVHSDQLLEWLWPESGLLARRSLNSALTVIRRALADAGGQRTCLAHSAGRYQRRPFEWVDLDAFELAVQRAEAAHRAGRLDLARRRYLDALQVWGGGELLTEDRYADWAEVVRARMTDMAGTASDALVELSVQLDVPTTTLAAGDAGSDRLGPP